VKQTKHCWQESEKQQKAQRLMALSTPATVALFPKVNFKNKTPPLHWLRTQVTEHPQPSGDQVGFETGLSGTLKKLRNNHSSCSQCWERDSARKMIFSIKVFVTLLNYLKIPQVPFLGDLYVCRVLASSSGFIYDSIAQQTVYPNPCPKPFSQSREIVNL
jgi:hypothetical protein